MHVVHVGAPGDGAGQQYYWLPLVGCVRSPLIPIQCSSCIVRNKCCRGVVLAGRESRQAAERKKRCCVGAAERNLCGMT